MFLINKIVINKGYTNDDYIICATNNNCTAAPAGGANTMHSGAIASGQGFFAVAGTANPNDLVFNNSMRLTTGNDQFRNPEVDRMWINLTNTETQSGNQTLFTFTENGSANFNHQYDAIRLGSGYAMAFYSLAADNGNHLAVDDRGLYDTTITIPVGYYINDDTITNLKFSIDHFENLEDTNVYLIDNLLNLTHDLKIADYSFTTNATGVYNNRFEIMFEKGALSTGNETLNDKLVVSNVNDNVKVNMLDGSIITNLIAFDVIGKKVIDMQPNASNFMINTVLKQGQVLFIKATLENGQVLNNKFMKL